NTSTAGEYEVVYTVSDAAGNEATEIRIVNVVETDGEDPAEAALNAVNEADTAEEMRSSVENEDLDLNLTAYNSHNTYKQNKIANHMLENRPEEGFADSDDVQAALNQANFELYVSPTRPDDPVEPAFNAVNDADNSEEMQAALENEDLG